MFRHLLVTASSSILAGVLLSACGGNSTASPVDGPASALPPPPSAEELLRKEVDGWKGTPFADRGTTKKGVGNAAFVQAVLKAALGRDVPGTEAEQFRSGKLVERDALAPGDLVFFETKGIGPLKTRFVGIFIGNDEVAIARRDTGVTIVKTGDTRWTYRTARRSADPNAEAPTFNAARYGNNRGALLRDIATAWAGTLYRDGGTTFEGIGNDEFVREVYGAVYEVELEGTQKAWSGLGQAVKRDALQPGDLILYDSKRMGGLVTDRHAGLYIDNGEFMHAVRGAAVTISKLDDAAWRAAYKGARRVDPEALERQAADRSARAAAAAKSAAARPDATPGGTAPARRADTASAIAAAAPAVQSAHEKRLRAAAEPWWGTPYKIGGTSKNGVDCSAFVRAVYGDVYRVELPRTAEEQQRLGAKVDRGDLEPGDLVFFRTQGMGPLFRSRHVGVYLGDGVFAHASGKRGVATSRLDDYYWNKKYATARRLPKNG